MDILAFETIKNAAKCERSYVLQNSVSHRFFERILHFLWEYTCLSVYNH